MEKVVAAILAGIPDGAVFGLVALGIVLVYKATRVLNFAQAEIGTVAIYLTWWLQVGAGIPTPLAVLVALVAAALLGAATERALRPLADAPRLTVTVATLGVSAFLGALQFVIWGPFPRIPPRLVSGTPFVISRIPFPAGRLLALVVTAALGVGLYLILKRTLFGLGVLAAAQDTTALRLMGLPFGLVSSFTWAVGAVLAALAGIILAPTIGSFHPFFMTLMVIPSLTAALIGGLTSLPGALVGGLVVGVVWNLAQFLFGAAVPGAEFVAAFGLVVLVLMIRPQGLLGSEA
ncbi:MAG: branched-chain amino acid ABC transporter permease [Acidobacteria bacterium]|nr:branched-chain amino acid ABC transporter permease [Acidobacteriota bacterium]